MDLFAHCACDFSCSEQMISMVVTTTIRALRMSLLALCAYAVIIVRFSRAWIYSRTAHVIFRALRRHMLGPKMLLSVTMWIRALRMLITKAMKPNKYIRQQ